MGDIYTETTLKITERERTTIERIWNHTCKNLSLGDTEAFEEVYNKYNEPSRSYHGVIHLFHCVTLAEKNHSLFDYPHEAMMALFFHDFVYDTHNNDMRNIEDSIAECKKYLSGMGCKEEQMTRIVSGIKATSHTENVVTNDEKLIADIDLAMIVAYADEAIEFMIRKEYDWVPEDQYLTSRKEILKAFYLRENIYHSNVFRKSLENKTKTRLLDMIRINGMNVLVAGTFDLFHKGHKILIKDAFQVAGKHYKPHVTIGLTSDKMASRKTHPVQPYEVRKKQLAYYITRMDPHASWEIVPLEDKLGDTATNPKYDVLVVSKETIAGADYVNTVRKENKLPPLIIHTIEVVVGGDGERISSTKLRKEGVI